MLAIRIVDSLIESRFSDEDMAEFGDVAGMIFKWNYTPMLRHQASSDLQGAHTLNFRLLNYGVEGRISTFIERSGSGGPDCYLITFSVNIHLRESPLRVVNEINTRQRLIRFRFEGVEAIHDKFEEFVRGPVVKLLKQRRLTKANLEPSIKKLLASLAYTPV